MQYTDDSIEFDWDDVKAEHNQKKHKLAFEEAARIWLRPNELVVEQDFGDYIAPAASILAQRSGDYDEDRFVAYGRLPNNTILYVVHTYRAEIIWLISARKAEPKERKYYLEALHRPKW